MGSIRRMMVVGGLCTTALGVACAEGTHGESAGHDGIGDGGNVGSSAPTSGSTTTATGGAGGDGGSSATSSGSTTATGGGGTAGGAGDCAGSEEKCEGSVHFVCDGGQFTQQDCPNGQGCDAQSGTCTDCACIFGDPPTCLNATTVQTCDSSCHLLSATCSGTLTCFNGACLDLVCNPGSPDCIDSHTVQLCLPDGSGYEPAMPCGPKQECAAPSGCQSLCDLAAANPSSVGCSFFALNMDNQNDDSPDAVAIGNPSDALTAVVNLYGSPGGVETLLQGNVSIPPLGLYTWVLPNAPSDVIEAGTTLRLGGAFRVESDLPVVAYQHSPLQPQATNDASCLLPEHALGTHYVVGSYTDQIGTSYLDVIATQNGTTVTVRPKMATGPGGGLPGILPGQTLTLTLDRYDTLQISANDGPNADITGTDILSSAPVAVFGAVECAQVPVGMAYCDHIEEQSLPEHAWGQAYVAAHAPRRSGAEHFYWRIMAYKDNTVIDTQPQLPGFPKTLNTNEFYEFTTQPGSLANPQVGSFILTGSEPFAALQYLEGQLGGAGTGDPASMTLVPVEQFLSRYVVLTPTGYIKDYIQVIRPAGGADVFIDGVAIGANEYYTVGSYQVADRQVSAGSHTAISNDPFGIMGVGYTDATSYAYPGGLALKILHQ